MMKLAYFLHVMRNLKMLSKKNLKLLIIILSVVAAGTAALIITRRIISKSDLEKITYTVKKRNL